MCVTFVDSSDPIPTHSLRQNYLEGLSEAQEMFLEWPITTAQGVDILAGGCLVGYAAIAQGNQLLEFHLERSEVNRCDEIFRRLVAHRGISRAYIKSFDSLALACAAKAQKTMSVAGLLYREQLRTPAFPLPSGIEARKATAGDAQRIAAINENVFDSDADIAAYIARGQVVVFSRSSVLLGFCLFARVIEGRPEFDIGMLVARAHRQQGLGVRFLAYAASTVLVAGGRPTMGCAVDNRASRACIERLGYCARYRMLEFEF